MALLNNARRRVAQVYMSQTIGLKKNGVIPSRARDKRHFFLWPTQHDS
jgi:hypothetical protein